MEMVRVALATSMWVAALLMMAVAEATDVARELRGWAMLVGLGASVLTLWHLMVVERHRVETIARLLDREDKPEQGLRRV